MLRENYNLAVKVKSKLVRDANSNTGLMRLVTQANLLDRITEELQRENEERLRNLSKVKYSINTLFTKNKTIQHDRVIHAEHIEECEISDSDSDSDSEDDYYYSDGDEETGEITYCEALPTKLTVIPEMTGVVA
ncbi:hypothetical protein CLIB1444_14S01332 [[Candida] jaroonii]|uniref:Uncharacterized protein n=1 Tax=[Candida] jaroonii TaxID=467808 RepID=A0ACA9YFT5_9ASCO|nr:hypothetical protein CLIB1444_14S01332 [[Candida] jaroonii]